MTGKCGLKEAKAMMKSSVHLMIGMRGFCCSNLRYPLVISAMSQCVLDNVNAIDVFRAAQSAWTTRPYSIPGLAFFVPFFSGIRKLFFLLMLEHERPNNVQI